MRWLRNDYVRWSRVHFASFSLPPRIFGVWMCLVHIKFDECKSQQVHDKSHFSHRPPKPINLTVLPPLQHAPAQTIAKDGTANLHKKSGEYEERLENYPLKKQHAITTINQIQWFMILHWTSNRKRRKNKRTEIKKKWIKPNAKSNTDLFRCKQMKSNNSRSLLFPGRYCRYKNLRENDKWWRQIEKPNVT